MKRIVVVPALKWLQYPPPPQSLHRQSGLLKGITAPAEVTARKKAGMRGKYFLDKAICRRSSPKKVWKGPRRSAGSPAGRTPSQLRREEGVFPETDRNPTLAFIEHRHYRSFGRLPLGAVLLLSAGMRRGREMRRGGRAGSETIMYMQCCRRERRSRNIIALFRPDAPRRKGG